MRSFQIIRFQEKGDLTTKYRPRGLLAVILGRIKNLHFEVDGWFIQRRSHILKVLAIYCMHLVISFQGTLQDIIKYLILLLHKNYYFPTNQN